MKLQKLIIGTILLLLVGCSTTQHRSASIVNANDGALVVRILPNTLGSGQFRKHWESLTVERLPDDINSTASQYSLEPIVEASSSSVIYAGSLPSGRYRFLKFPAHQCLGMCETGWVEVSSGFSRFDIKSGHLTNLGVIVQSPSSTDGKKMMLAHGPLAGDTLSDEIVREFAPGLTTLLGRPSLSWQSESVSKQMELAFEYSKLTSFSFFSPREVSDGSFIYGSANGIVYRMTPGQKPIAHDVGERKSIEAILASSSGSWYAGGELGLLMMSDDEGKSWRSIRGNLPLGVVVDLHEWQGTIIATIVRGARIYIYASPLGADNWTALAEYQTVVGYSDPTGVRPRSFLMDDMLITGVPGRNVASLDLNTNAFEIYPLPGSLQMLSVSEDGVLRCRCIATMAVNPYESRDFGKTWKESSESRFLLMPTFRDRMNGVAFQSAILSAATMAYTNDGGVSWIQTTEMPVAPNEIFYSKDKTAAYLASIYGELWISKDDGRSWQKVPR
ncbi:MAG: hypothetical protein ACRBBM_01405 [Pseudomonadaceae bacterium]